MRELNLSTVIGLLAIGFGALQRRGSSCVTATATTPPAPTAKPPAPIASAAPLALEAPSEIHLQSGLPARFGAFSLHFTQMWCFKPRRIKPRTSFPLQTIELRYGVTAAGATPSERIELSPGESFIAEDTVFTLTSITPNPTAASDGSVFIVGGGRAVLQTRRVAHVEKSCAGDLDLVFGTVCVLPGGRRASLLRLGPDRATVRTQAGRASPIDSNFDFGVARDPDDATFSYIEEHRDIEAGSLRLRREVEAAPSIEVAFSKPFVVRTDAVYHFPDGLTLQIGNGGLTPYGRLFVEMILRRFADTRSLFIEVPLYVGDDAPAPRALSVLGRQYEPELASVTYSPKVTMSISIAPSKLPLFKLGEAFVLAANESKEAATGEIVYVSPAGHRNVIDASGKQRTKAWVDVSFYAEGRAQRFSIDFESPPGAVRTVGAYTFTIRRASPLSLVIDKKS